MTYPMMSSDSPSFTQGEDGIGAQCHSCAARWVWLNFPPRRSRPSAERAKHASRKEAIVTSIMETPSPPTPIVELGREEWVRRRVGPIRRTTDGKLAAGEIQRIADAIVESSKAGSVTTREFALVAYENDDDGARMAASSALGSLAAKGKLRRVKPGVYDAKTDRQSASKKKLPDERPRSGDLLEVVGLWGANHFVLRDMESQAIVMMVLRPVPDGR